MSPPLVMVGGPVDGRREAHLFGDTILTAAPSGERFEYRIVTLRGSTRFFSVAVPADRWNDADWLLERLLDGYSGGGA